MTDRGRVKQRYRQFAYTECSGYSDLYYAFALAVSEDDEVVDFIAAMPVIRRTCFLRAAVLTYVKRDRRRAFAGIPADASKSRDIVWLSSEPPGVISEITALAPPQTELRYLLGRTLFTNGHRRDELLAHAHPHGADLAWL